MFFLSYNSHAENLAKLFIYLCVCVYVYVCYNVKRVLNACRK